jgi:hypothetical protein
LSDASLEFEASADGCSTSLSKVSGTGSSPIELSCASACRRPDLKPTRYFHGDFIAFQPCNLHRNAAAASNTTSCVVAPPAHDVNSVNCPAENALPEGHSHDQPDHLPTRWLIESEALAQFGIFLAQLFRQRSTKPLVLLFAFDAARTGATAVF